MQYTLIYLKNNNYTFKVDISKNKNRGKTKIYN